MFTTALCARPVVAALMAGLRCLPRADRAQLLAYMGGFPELPISDRRRRYLFLFAFGRNEPGQLEMIQLWAHVLCDWPPQDGTTTAG
jgi:hypothetical protein